MTGRISNNPATYRSSANTPGWVITDTSCTWLGEMPDKEPSTSIKSAGRMMDVMVLMITWRIMEYLSRPVLIYTYPNTSPSRKA